MKTRFTPLVKIKKNSLDKCERDFSRANRDKQNAQSALDDAYLQLKETSSLSQGNMSDMLQERTILDIQRNVIEQKRSWLNFASQQVTQLKKLLQEATIEYEKYKYLETKEIEMILKKRAQVEMKQLDESALHSFMYRQDQQ
ncbi:MAG: flagellar export protein FliJ [Campylobacterota bacterium]|nr:flagellar export protein FliJ [Campylobacterota bacterium]